MSEKLTRADAKLQNLPQEALDELWRYRHPEEGGEAMTLEAICAELPKRFNISISISSLSVFYRWLAVRQRLDARAALSDQLKLELAKNPEVSEKQIQQAGRRLFMAEGIIEKDAKVFAEMVKIGQNDQRLSQNDQKIGLDKRKLAILEKKAAQADAAKDVLGQSLSLEEQNRRMREILK
ncbi:MAG: hypothetical protein WCP45_18475 [Verrucomicrobiota bacterium]